MTPRAQKARQLSRLPWPPLFLPLLLLLLCAGPALAHKGSDAYLDVQQGGGTGTGAGVEAQESERDSPQQIRFVLSVALRDLDQLVAVDANSDGRITWGEVKAATPALLATLDHNANTAPPDKGQPGAQGGGAGAAACRLTWQADGLERRSDGSYLRAEAHAQCAPAQPLAFYYTLFRAQDSTHRLLVSGRLNGTDLLSTTSPQHTEPLLLRAGAGGAATGQGGAGAAHRTGRWDTLHHYFGLGAQHLLQGYDHLAFLLALVLPLHLVLGRRSGTLAARTAATAEASGAATWLALLRTVTAFTVGHSITLVLATFGFTQASPRWVEPVIALSIGVTAWLNLRPIAGLRTEWLALAFGLVHGYGFAGLLQEAAAPSALLGWALAGFNLGVEGGQLLAVAVWVVLVQALVRQRWYGSVVVRGGSALLLMLSALWFWQRVA